MEVIVYFEAGVPAVVAADEPEDAMVVFVEEAEAVEVSGGTHFSLWTNSLHHRHVLPLTVSSLCGTSVC